MSDILLNSLPQVPPDPAVPNQEAAVEGIGQWALVWRRFRRHRLAVIGGYIALAMVALALIGPLVAPRPAMTGLNGQTPLTLWAHRNSAPRLWPLDRYVMGADAVGNPVLAFILWGGRAVLAISVLGALLASVLGILVGSLAGYLGRAVDVVLMRMVDAVLAIPFLLLLILLTRYMTDRSTVAYIALFGMAGWPGVARLVRGYVISLRRREYAEAARALGVSSLGIILRHILPNALDVITVSFTLNVGVFLATEVTMEYLGAGTSDVTWGTLLPAAFGGILNSYWWLGVFPGLAILLVVLAVNFLGDGLRDALDVTSRTAAFSAYPRPRRSWSPGPVARAGGAVLQWTARPFQLASDASRELADRWRRDRTRLLGALPVRPHAGESSGSVAGHRPSPLPLRIAPIALVFTLLGTVFLYGHSPLAYAPHYAPPTSLGSVYGASEYAAAPFASGNWEVFEVNGRGQLVYQQVDLAGTTVRQQVMSSGNADTRPSMARRGNRVLGAWVADGGQTIEAAYLNVPFPKHPNAAGHPIRLVPLGGIAEHPYVVAVPGGFDVLFDWQRPGTTSYDLELASYANGAASPTIKRLLGPSDHAVYVRAIMDGSGALDVLYLRRTSPGIWRVYLQRVAPRGVALARPVPLATISYVLFGPNGCTLPDAYPLQWAIDLKRASDGSVWGAWEGGNDCVTRTGITGTNTLYLGHWSRLGRPIGGIHTVDSSVDPSTQSVALALQGPGGQIFYTRSGPVVPFLVGVHFSGAGVMDPAERISYEGGGSATNPRAGTAGGRPRVLWQKVRGDGAVLQATTYRAAQPPDLLTQLGLNVGSLPGNVLLLTVGSLGGAILVALANVGLLVPLIPVWLAVQLVASGRTRRALFLAAIALIVGWVFGSHASPPGYVAILSGLSGAARLDPWYRWMGVAGAVFAAAWADRSLFARQENSLRAAATALTAIYFVAALYLVLFIQVEITRI